MIFFTNIEIWQIVFNFKYLWDSLRAAMRQRRMSVRSDKLVREQEWSSSNKLVMSSSPLPPLERLQIVKEQLKYNKENLRIGGKQ